MKPLEVTTHTTHHVQHKADLAIHVALGKGKMAEKKGKLDRNLEMAELSGFQVHMDFQI